MIFNAEQSNIEYRVIVVLCNTELSSLYFRWANVIKIFSSARQCSSRGGELQINVRQDHRVEVAGKAVLVLQGSLYLWQQELYSSHNTLLLNDVAWRLERGYLCVTCPKKVCEGDWSLAERSIFLISINYARVYDASLDSHRKMFSVREFGFLCKWIQFWLSTFFVLWFTGLNITYKLRIVTVVGHRKLL